MSEDKTKDGAVHGPVCYCWVREANERAKEAGDALREISESLMAAGCPSNTIHGAVLRLIADKEAAEERLSDASRVIAGVVEEMEAAGRDTCAAQIVQEWRGRLLVVSRGRPRP